MQPGSVQIRIKSSFPLFFLLLLLVCCKSEDVYVEPPPEPLNGLAELPMEEFAVGTLHFSMIHVPVPSGGIVFPVWSGEGDQYDDGLALMESPYWIGECEVTWELWNAVRRWASAYTIDEGRRGSAGRRSDHVQQPLTMVNWYDAVVWCNALTEWINDRLEMDMVPVYYYDEACTRLARERDEPNFEKETGKHYGTAFIKEGADGFRLPSSLEWKLAARWQGTEPENGDSIAVNNRGLDLFFSPGRFASGADGEGEEAAAISAVFGRGNTVRVKSRAPNSLGCYDMSGNVREWCYDWTAGRHSSGGTEADNSYRTLLGSACNETLQSIEGTEWGRAPEDLEYLTGFRLARTAFIE
jgi:formylglycine-generating enzyme required for sulfatase activity